MSQRPSRRQFIAATTGAAASAIFVRGANSLPIPTAYFKLSVITDEITQDLARALEIASHEFGLHYVELRGLWKKNIISLDAKEIAEVRGLLDRFQLQVTDIASPLFKTDFPGAPKSSFRPNPSMARISPSTSRTRSGNEPWPLPNLWEPIASAASISGVSRTTNP